MTQRSLGHMRPGHTGQPLNYVDTDKAYISHDVPIKNVNARKQILHFLDPDILGTKKKPWNNMTTPSGPFADHRGPMNQGTMPFAPRFPDPSRKRSLHIGTSTRAEIDKRAESIPKRDPVRPTKISKLQFDPRKLLGETVPENLGGTGTATMKLANTVPPGKAGKVCTRFIVQVDPTGKLDMLEPWNPSTQPVPNVLVQNELQTLEMALENSKKKQPLYTSKRTGLLQSYKKNRDTQRGMKKVEALKEKDYEQYLTEMRTLRLNSETEEMEENKRKELDRMELVYSKDWKQKEYYCDGKWAYDEREGRHCWSCCGSFQQDPPGCQPRKATGKGWNFASIN
jgi:hypothetical protein